MCLPLRWSRLVVRERGVPTTTATPLARSGSPGVGGCGNGGNLLGLTRVWAAPFGVRILPKHARATSHEPRGAAGFQHTSHAGRVESGYSAFALVPKGPADWLGYPMSRECFRSTRQQSFAHPWSPVGARRSGFTPSVALTGLRRESTYSNPLVGAWAGGFRWSRGRRGYAVPVKSFGSSVVLCH